MRTLTLLLVLLVTALPAPAAASGRYWSACPSEHREDFMSKCVWDARHMGDGRGRSFFANLHGIHYVSHARAHRMHDQRRL